MITPTVLVLEDDDVLRVLLTEIIEELGEVVVSFASADEGMMFLETGAGQLNLIVSDISMPGLLDGYELSKVVTLRWPSLSMILTSGEVNLALELGANIRFLPKPWIGDAMFNLVVCVLAQGRKLHSRTDL